MPQCLIDMHLTCEGVLLKSVWEWQRQFVCFCACVFALSCLRVCLRSFVGLCLCICVLVFLCLRFYVCVFVFLSLCFCVFVFLRLWLCVCVFVFVCLFVFLCGFVFVFLCLCCCVCVFAFSRTTLYYKVLLQFSGLFGLASNFHINVGSADTAAFLQFQTVSDLFQTSLGWPAISI